MQQSSLSCELESSEAGVYSPNRAFIRLNKQSAFWKPEVSSSPTDYAVFLHEYTHYLHNFSTSAGISDFLYELRAAQYFLMTVGVDGTSAGLSDLEDAAQQEYSATQRLRGALRGNFKLPAHAAIHRTGIELEYVRHAITETTFHFPSQEVRVDLVELDLRVTSASAEPSVIKVSFGTMLLTEGVAFELECLYLERRHHDIRAYQKGVKPMPYMVARRVLEGMTGRYISHDLCIKACLLALQATDAGAHFFEIAGRLRDAPDMESVITRLAGETKQSLKSSLPRLATAVDESTDPFTGRSLIRAATGHLARTAIAYMTERTVDVFFELELVKSDPKSHELNAFLSRFPPCMIQVLDPGSTEPNALEFAIPMKVDSAFVDSLAAYHSMMHFGLAHFAQNLGSTDSLKPKACPFLSSCSLPLKLSRPDICEVKPWESFDPHSQTICWYAAGVAVARGRPT